MWANSGVKVEDGYHSSDYDSDGKLSTLKSNKKPVNRLRNLRAYERMIAYSRD
jgi:hypothetical protein